MPMLGSFFEKAGQLQLNAVIADIGVVDWVSVNGLDD